MRPPIKTFPPRNIKPPGRVTTMWAAGCGPEIARNIVGSSAGDIAQLGSKSRGIYARHYDNPDITKGAGKQKRDG